MSELMTLIKNKFYASLWSPLVFAPGVQGRNLVGDDDDRQHHQRHGKGQRQRDLPAEGEHQRDRHDRLNGGGDDRRERIGNKVVHAVDVGRKVAHDLAHLALVEPAHGQALQVIEQIAAQLCHGPDRNVQQFYTTTIP